MVKITTEIMEKYNLLYDEFEKARDESDTLVNGIKETFKNENIEFEREDKDGKKETVKVKQKECWVVIAQMKKMGLDFTITDEYKALKKKYPNAFAAAHLDISF